MQRRQLCLSVSRPNMKRLELLDDYALEFGLNRAQTFFRIISDYDIMKKWSVCNKDIANE